MSKRRRKKNPVEAILNSGTSPVFLLDAEQVVLFFNSGCEQLTGWSAAEVVGEQCRYATSAEPNELAAITGCLCPPPDVLQGEETSVPVYLPTRSGETVPRQIQFFPLVDEDNQVHSILGFISAIKQPATHTKTTSAQQLHAELAALRLHLRQQFGLKTLVCQSHSMHRVLEQVRVAIQSVTPLLIQGEPGTGKEHIARLIHFESESRRSAFIPINCAELPPFQIQQVLKRLFQPETTQTATLEPSTLYLSEIQALPRDLQEKVLNFVRKTSQKGHATIRLMAASSKNLQHELEAENLIPEFYYHITPLHIELPALKSRPEDIPLLAQYLLEENNRGRDQQLGGFAEEVWEQFSLYNWPGNIDELTNVVSEACSVCSGNLVLAQNLPFRFRTGMDAQSLGPSVKARAIELEKYLDQVEREKIVWALEAADYVKSKAAKLLGIQRARLYRRMETLEIEDRET